MSKLGRYSANRLKIEEFNAYATATLAKTIEVADCGTVFAMTAAGNDAYEGATITLPTIAAAGAGWWARFVLVNDIAADGSDNNNILIQDASGDSSTMVVHLPADAAVDGAGEPAGASVTFVEGAAEAGDEAEFVCTGTRWLCHVRCATVGGVTVQT